MPLLHFTPEDARRATEWARQAALPLIGPKHGGDIEIRIEEAPNCIGFAELLGERGQQFTDGPGGTLGGDEHVGVQDFRTGSANGNPMKVDRAALGVPRQPLAHLSRSRDRVLARSRAFLQTP
jgi:hypothetical protein